MVKITIIFVHTFYFLFISFVSLVLLAGGRAGSTLVLPIYPFIPRRSSLYLSALFLPLIVHGCLRPSP